MASARPRLSKYAKLALLLRSVERTRSPKALYWCVSSVATLIVVAIGSIFLQFYFGPLFFVPIEVLGPRTAGMATGLTNLFANTGGLLTAYALGVVKDAFGSFAGGFIGIGGMCLIGVALSVALARVRKRALLERAAIP